MPHSLALTLVFLQIAAGEAKNPRRNLPKAIKRVYIRILLFYIGGVIVIGLLVPSSEPDLHLTTSNAAKSPFVIAIKRAGISGLPSVSRSAHPQLSPWILLLIASDRSSTRRS